MRIQALQRIDWKVFALLLTAGLLGVVAVLPYAFELIVHLPAGAGTPEIPMPLVIALALVQNGILLAIAIVIGMLLSERVGLRMPLVRAWAAKEKTPHLRPIVVPGVLLGALAGALLVAIEAAFFARHLPPAMSSAFTIPLWKRLLAGIVYGGLTEELLMRLFLLSLVVWLLGKWWKTEDNLPTRGAFWAAIVLVAVLFGLGHLPVTAVMTPLTEVLIVRAVVLNGVVGIAYGYLYWRHGLESASLAHMSTHLVLQMPGTLLIQAVLER
jgi:membrane protease YdiL (CAAX protease family)